jgi:beta-lactamase superfamily II metal-dependent hydrolase/flagellar hook-basal body complex protein FliE
MEKPKKSSQKKKEKKQKNPATIETKNSFNTPAYLRIIHIDVAQGESTLFIVGLKNDENPLFTALIDGGKAMYSSHITSTLAKYGIKTLDAIINTHYDADHIEGLTQLMKNANKESNNETEPVQFKRVYARSAAEEENEDKRTAFHKEAEGKLKVISANCDLVDDLEETNKGKIKLCDFSFKCIAVNNGKGFDENDNSAAFLVTFGNFKYFTAGDLTTEQEKNLIGELTNLTAFKCGHHGSKHSTSEKFLAKTEPKVAFISAGKHSYCHPHEPVLQGLHDQKIATYLTNCCYNRPQINPDYIQSEIKLLPKYIDILKGYLNNNTIVNDYEEPIEKVHKIAIHIKQNEDENFKKYSTSIKEILVNAEKQYKKKNDKKEKGKKEKDTEEVGYFVEALQNVCNAINKLENYTKVDVKAFVSGSKNHLGNVELYCRRSDVSLPVTFFHVGYAKPTEGTDDAEAVWHKYEINGGMTASEQKIEDNYLVGRICDYLPPFSLPSLASKEERITLCDIYTVKCEEPSIYTCKANCAYRCCEKHGNDKDNENVKFMGEPDKLGYCIYCRVQLEQSSDEEYIVKTSTRNSPICKKCRKPVEKILTNKHGNDYYHPDCYEIRKKERK